MTLLPTPTAGDAHNPSKNDVTLSRRQAEDLLEILAEFRSQHLREAAWDYPQFDFQRRMLVNLGEIEAQVYQSIQGLSE